MSDATLVANRPWPMVRLERQLADSPDVVWRALTERDQLRAWFPCDVLVEGDEWAPGARISFPFPPETLDLTLEGQVLEVEPPRRLAFTWGEETLRFELQACESGTLLVLTDELPPSFAARNAAGWESCLDRLAGIEPARDGWQSRFDMYVARFQPVAGHQDGIPESYKGESS